MVNNRLLEKKNTTEKQNSNFAAIKKTNKHLNKLLELVLKNVEGGKRNCIACEEAEEEEEIIKSADDDSKPKSIFCLCELWNADKTKKSKKGKF